MARQYSLPIELWIPGCCKSGGVSYLFNLCVQCFAVRLAIKYVRGIGSVWNLARACTLAGYLKVHFAEAPRCVTLPVAVAHTMYDFTYTTSAESKGGCAFCIAWMCMHMPFNACLNGIEIHAAIGAIDKKQEVCGVAAHSRWSWLWKRLGCSCCLGTFTSSQIIYRSSTHKIPLFNRDSS